MLRLFEHPLSPYAQKVNIALYEKGLPFEATVPDIFGGTDREFLASSPRHEVPTLIRGDVMIFDSTIILEYLEETWPAPLLLPPDPAMRARVEMIDELCDTYFEAITWGVAEIRVFGRTTGDLAHRMLDRARQQVAQMYRRLERELGSGPGSTVTASGGATSRCIRTWPGPSDRGGPDRIDGAVRVAHAGPGARERWAPRGRGSGCNRGVAKPRSARRTGAVRAGVSGPPLGVDYAQRRRARRAVWRGTGQHPLFSRVRVRSVDSGGCRAYGQALVVS